MSIGILVIPIVVITLLTLAILSPIWLRHRTRVLALRTISEAIACGRETDVALVERLLLPPQPAVGRGFALLNLFLGVSATCVGAALALAVRSGVATGAEAAGMTVGSCVNLGIGIGLSTLGLVSKRLLSGMHRPAPRWDYATILALVTLFLGASALGVCAGLTTAALVAAPAMGQDAAAGMLTGAFVNGCSGIGFTGLGIFILRTFAVYTDT